MLFVQPAWNLCGVDCPRKCGGSRNPLTLHTCPSCSNVVLVCDDCVAVYGSPRELADGGVAEMLAEPFDWANVSCPVCDSVPLSGYRLSTSEEVRALGFRPGEYE